jgi:OOP family OmpA-OmpF porin
MLKRTLMIAVSATALLAAGNANAKMMFYDVERIQEQSFAGDGFSQHLAREYKEFATSEAYKMYDWIDAEHFAAKAISANKGEMPMPEEVSSWSLTEEHHQELTRARGRLMEAFAKGGREAAPSNAATAQAKFDCWIEQQEENWQLMDIAACKAAFYAAMSGLEAAMAPKKVAMQQTKTETVEFPVTQLGVVFFGFDRSSLDAAANAKLDAIIGSLKNKDEVELRVVGYTDSAGPADYNQELSRKRAEAVMAGLRARGLNVGELEVLDVNARGESGQAVETADGVRSAANRRVEITARAKQKITVTTTK